MKARDGNIKKTQRSFNEQKIQIRIQKCLRLFRLRSSKKYKKKVFNLTSHVLVALSRGKIEASLSFSQTKTIKGMHKNVHLQKVFLTVMRISILQFVLAILFSPAALAHDIKGQGVLDRRISIEVSNLAVKTVLKKIEKNAAVRFAYQPQLLFNMDRVSVVAEDTPLSDVLRMIFRETVHYEAVGDQIILKEQTVENETNKTIQGRVVDENKQPLPGVNVVEKGPTNGTVTDAEGKYSLSAGDEAVLVFTFVGYKAQEISTLGRTIIDAELVSDSKTLDELVVIGYGEQSKKLLT